MTIRCTFSGRKIIFDDEYLCYEFDVYRNPNYVKSEEQNTLEINSLLISSGFNQWNNNGSWDVSNAANDFNGFGYDDVIDITEYEELFLKGQDGKK